MWLVGGEVWTSHCEVRSPRLEVHVSYMLWLFPFFCSMKPGASHHRELDYKHHVDSADCVETLFPRRIKVWTRTSTSIEPDASMSELLIPKFEILNIGKLTGDWIKQIRAHSIKLFLNRLESRTIWNLNSKLEFPPYERSSRASN